MKTAISIPDEIFEAADRAARRLGISRSELYATAVHEFIEKNRTEGVTEKLDKVYALSTSELDKNLQKMQAHTLKKEDW